MRALRKLMDRVGVPFAKGGPLEKFYPAYEAADTFLFTPPYTTAGGPHVRDAIDQKRIMITVVLALIPLHADGHVQHGLSGVPVG
jgi:Na+-transporting NADH:ubiquinone oxidoreductase subunit B